MSLQEPQTSSERIRIRAHRGAQLLQLCATVAKGVGDPEFGHHVLAAGREVSGGKLLND